MRVSVCVCVCFTHDSGVGYLSLRNSGAYPVTNCVCVCACALVGSTRSQGKESCCSGVLLLLIWPCDKAGRLVVTIQAVDQQYGIAAVGEERDRENGRMLPLHPEQYPESNRN